MHGLQSFLWEAFGGPDYTGINSARHWFLTIWWLKLVYWSTVRRRRSCIVCSGSSNRHPGDSLPWVTPVSDTLSAAYMPPTPPLLHPSLCASSLFPLGTILPPLSSQDCFSLFSDSPALCHFFFSLSILMSLYTGSLLTPPHTLLSPPYSLSELFLPLPRLMIR